jgi:hypothetical protein
MLKFKYTKSNGEVTERVGLIMQSARKNDLMLDLTACDEEERFIVENLLADYRTKLDALNKEYSKLSNYMKEFKPEGISERKTI